MENRPQDGTAIARSASHARRSRIPRAPAHPDTDRADKEETMAKAQQTTDHDTIKTWIEARKGRPSKVAGNGKSGILRVDFREKDDDLNEIGWDEFFRIFEESHLAFLFQEETASGEKSRFNKFIERD